jgi:hypothetical protein
VRCHGRFYSTAPRTVNDVCLGVASPNSRSWFPCRDVSITLSLDLDFVLHVHFTISTLNIVANMVYVRQDKLPNLKQYKYSGVDHSLLSRYVLKPFYTHVVIKCFPMSMAPNLITLTGFSFVVINLLTLLWYNPTLDQDCPPWVYASWAVGLFLYQTFDAVDGSQA